MVKPVYLQYPDGNVIVTEHPEYHSGTVRLSAKAGKAAKAEYSRRKLLEWIQPGSKVYTILRHVAASGMSRRIDCYIIRDGSPLYISRYVSDVIGWPIPDDRNQGIKVDGCGMDAGFHLVYTLGRSLWPDGTPDPHGFRNGQPDSDGGYALKHEWL